LVDLQQISLIVQIVGVSGTAIAAVIGVSSYINSNKRAEEAKKKEQETRDRDLQTRQAQMFMNIYNQVTMKDFIAAWNIFCSSDFKNFKEYNEIVQKKDVRDAFTILGMYWEGLGVLVREGYLDIRLVALLICGMTRYFWEKLIPIKEDYRVEMGFVRWMSETEYLYNELMKYIDKHPELSTEMKRWPTSRTSNN
jgi:hypothetical protein